MTETYDPEKGYIKITLTNGPQKGRVVSVHATDFRRRISVQRVSGEEVDEYRTGPVFNNECEATFFCFPHDWRVDPTVVLKSNPPRRRVICVTCGEITSIATNGNVPRRNDPSTWDKAPEGSVFS